MSFFVQRRSFNTLLRKLKVFTKVEHRIKMSVFNGDFWNKKWNEGKTGFHKNEVNRLLLDNHQALTNGKQAAKIFVPLCGKSLDMKWLYDQGHTVVGVDVAGMAIEQFFTEHNIEYTRSPCEAVKGHVWKSKDGRIVLYECDLFNFNREVEGTFEAIYDRASLSANHKDSRQRYCALLTSLAGENCHYLVVTLDFDGTIHTGPPFSMPEWELFHYYSKDFSIDRISYKDAYEEKHRRWGLPCFYERLHLLVKK